jgi:hypothetical protein
MDLLDADLDQINLELEDDAPSSRFGRIKVSRHLPSDAASNQKLSALGACVRALRWRRRVARASASASRAPVPRKL